MTFTDFDYAERQTAPDEWLSRCVSDLVTRPVVFVGTQLHEPTLWQYMAFRRGKGGRDNRELRPQSYYVAPRLDAARRVVLESLNIEWVPLNAEQFATEVLGPNGDAIEEGRRTLRSRIEIQERRRYPLLVSDISSSAKARPESDYLSGAEPRWDDIQLGRAIARVCDTALYDTANALLRATPTSQPLIVPGTAGSGKSTSLMRLGLRLSGEGIAVYWVDEQSNIEPHRLREVITANDEPVAILVDDADLWGGYVSGWARDLTQIRPRVLFAAAARSSRIDGLLDPSTLTGTTPIEVTMPPLADDDIAGLIAVLDRANRLGVLKGMTDRQRVAAFKEQAGRQLLVAMIQATSGEKFREKAIEEFLELPDTQKRIYACVCLVTAERTTIDRSELLLAVGAADNETLNELEKLVNRHLVYRDDLQGTYLARHRQIAEEIVNGIEPRTYFGPVLEGLVFAFSSAVHVGMPRHARPWRRLSRFLNHEFVMRFTPNLAAARAIYERLETALSWEAHYWLHRGALEVETGDLGLATNFLDQARSLAPGDKRVQTEYAYLLMKKASTYPKHTSAADWFAEGKRTMQALIVEDGRRDAYPYHVLGSQGLSWVHKATLPQLERRALLRELVVTVQAGSEQHPRKRELAQLLADLQKEWLSTAVGS